MSPAIEFRLIANSHSTCHTDHVIVVKGSNGRYFWDYHDPALQNHHVMDLGSVADVMDTFNNLVHALSWDIDPYRSIQVTVPAFPPVMVEMHDLPRALPDIRQLLQSALFNMPQTMTAEQADVYMRDSADEGEDDDDEDDDDEDDDDEDDDDDDDDEDDEDDDDDDEDDEYADMPPLVHVEHPEAPSVQSHSYFTRLQERLLNQAAASTQTHSYFS